LHFQLPECKSAQVDPAERQGMFGCVPAMALSEQRASRINQRRVKEEEKKNNSMPTHKSKAAGKMFPNMPMTLCQWSICNKDQFVPTSMPDKKTSDSTSHSIIPLMMTLLQSHSSLLLRAQKVDQPHHLCQEEKESMQLCRNNHLPTKHALISSTFR